MKQKYYLLSSILATLTLLLTACVGGSQATPDKEAISTAAALTVEARFTQQAATYTETPVPPTKTPAPAATSTLGYPPTGTTLPGQPTPTTNGKPCYWMTFIADVTIPDGMIVAPGSKFTKTWRVRNDGNCVWDRNYSLTFAQGDSLGAPTNIPLTSSVVPGQSVDFSIDMVAPTTLGNYFSYWRISTPYGGSFGVGGNDQALIAQITVSDKPERDFGSVSVVYDYTRKPLQGCTDKGASYTFAATITVNAPGEIEYRWDRNPFDGLIERGKLTFTQAGSKTVYFTWSFQTDAVQNIDRWVALTTIVDSKQTTYDRVTFNFHCTP